jgi:hypothetical protein
VSAAFIVNLTDQLAAGGIDVLAARFPDRGDDAGIVQNRLETIDNVIAGTAISIIRKRIKRYQVELGRHRF